jgi:hypothetical protein
MYRRAVFYLPLDMLFTQFAERTECIRWGEWIFSIHLIFPAAVGPEVYSIPNRIEYQKQKNNVSGE